MLALKIIDVKDFMNQLLIGETFDHFQMIEASITTFNTFSIDGTLKRDFFDSDIHKMLDQSGRVYALWKETKPYCFQMIRGKRTPLHFKIIFSLSRKQITTLFGDVTTTFDSGQIKGLFLNLQYKNKELYCTTGVSLTTFLPDKTPEHLWDSSVLNFFKQHQIAIEQM